MIVVFTGPTISAREASNYLDAMFVGPVSQGDVIVATRGTPWAIAIIDGYFERVPAVTHKEILWAMSQGIHVFGASSMGALRAAELSAFGMEGTGKIFQDYLTGELQDDDEVAIAHAAADLDFRPVSEAMVNIRATFRHAVASGVLAQEQAAHLTAAAKLMFYPRRNYPEIVGSAVSDGILSEGKSTMLRDWLKKNRVDQKRADAIDLLTRIAQIVQERPAAKTVNYPFHHTEIWDHTMRNSCPVLRMLNPSK